MGNIFQGFGYLATYHEHNQSISIRVSYIFDGKVLGGELTFNKHEFKNANIFYARMHSLLNRVKINLPFSEWPTFDIFCNGIKYWYTREKG